MPPAIQEAVENHRRLARGECLFAAGSPATSLFAVRAGFLKLSVPEPRGGSRIVRFLLPGDVAGLDMFHTACHVTEAVALEDSDVCEIPRWRLEALCDIRLLLAGELADAYAHAAAVAGLSAPQAVAGFLLGLGERRAARGRSAHRFRLPVGRREIGNHLGLTMETVSRILSTMRAREWIEEDGGQLVLRSPQALRGIRDDPGAWDADRDARGGLRRGLREP